MAYEIHGQYGSEGRNFKTRLLDIYVQLCSFCEKNYNSLGKSYGNAPNLKLVNHLNRISWIRCGNL